MKHTTALIALLIFTSVSLVAKAQTLCSVNVKSELGDLLNIRADKFAVELKPNEVMLVHKHVKYAKPADNESAESETEMAYVWPNKAEFAVVSMELDGIHSSFWGAYMLRDGNVGAFFRGLDRGVRLKRFGAGGPDGISYEFWNYDLTEMVLSVRWTAEVKTYEAVVKDWPELQQYEKTNGRRPATASRAIRIQQEGQK